MASIWELQNQIGSYRQKVRDYEKQIERLKKVYHELGEIKSMFKKTRRNMEDIFQEKGTWRGETHTSFCRAGEELDSVCGDYYRKLDNAQDRVNKKIAELKAKKSELIPIINRLVALVQDLISEAENAMN